ncbi:IS4 family transposase [Humisphaera borealis]|uniref:IS4 family transposase n=1 Tax=Humisphaera borealis TaxID=2807512 RepID=A0A7M2WQX3_9BACT|nr:IS4 family transposase [Humisphaera borealis]QOV87552.1 IS4 family transposase [Humisphaera borealis]QOV87745.1 IS4 family transposase [Humisphaera borealis]QOV88041.1 IS4 family transposase [Humisphaera borealis]QOV88592.1 IS4 family transposase [Humisphaera borealis]QOV89335.1 IS4 family transposase [Humisphaera borealis]
MRRSGNLLDEHLHRLAALPAHGNTILGRDQLVKGLLLSFFDPMARSLRRIEDCGDFQGDLRLDKLARSTTADALAAFDPQLLVPLIDDLQQRVPNLGDADGLEGITRQIIAADGTYMTTLCDVAWAMRQKNRDGGVQGQVRANVQLDAGNWIPRVLTVSGDDGHSEAAAFAADLLPGVLYVVDRNFVEFGFLGAVLDKGSDFVVRIKSNQPAMTVVQTLPPSAADVEAGVIAEEVVRLPGRDAPAGLFRCITIESTDRSGESQALRLLTNLPAATVGAHVVGAVYRLRWQIELFFKWLKTWAGMDHLLSTSRNGITTQLYIAVIAVLMMYVQSGYRVSVYALAALGRVARGQMSIQEAMAVIAKRERERSLERARQARLRARKKLA